MDWLIDIQYVCVCVCVCIYMCVCVFGQPYVCGLCVCEFVCVSTSCQMRCPEAFPQAGWPGIVRRYATRTEKRVMRRQGTTTIQRGEGKHSSVYQAAFKVTFAIKSILILNGDDNVKNHKHTHTHTPTTQNPTHIHSHTNKTHPTDNLIRFWF